MRLTNEQTLEAVKQWQENDAIHPLTCAIHGDEKLVAAVSKMGGVFLYCPVKGCNWNQLVPYVVLESYVLNKK